MIRKHIIAALLAFALVLQLFTLTACSTKGSLKILDGAEEELAVLTSSNISKNTLKDSAYAAYLEVALEEAVGIIAELEDCSAKKAEKLLFSKGYTVHTAFNSTVFSSIQNAYKEHQEAELEFACAVTDLNGRLLAAFSAGREGKNLATENTAPYSAFKPLSVYAPAIDAGVANWSTVYRDAPVKKISAKKGEEEDWPSNPAGTYTYKDTTLFDGLQQSLNTVAVRCLQEYGVQNSIDQLKENYGIDLTAEENRANVSGEDEVLGNIALGYLSEGVSPIDMAGYYQVFGNNGGYIAPKAVTLILDKDGEEVYSSSAEETQVMKKTTAYIVNQLLQGVTAPAGTGNKAVFGEIPVAGKTGTGEEGNWFVGITPEYSCAVWHGNEYTENRAAEIFASAVGGFKHSEDAQFNGAAGLRKAVYCSESGKLLSKKCIKMQMGYYESSSVPAICDKH